MNELMAKYQSLRKAVEARYGRTVSVRSDFDTLSREMMEETHLQLSSTTLRRFWDYQNDQSSVGLRESSLDVLCKYAGYRNWRHFCNIQPDDNSSHQAPNSRIYLEDLAIGTFIRMTWLPDREVVVRYEGDFNFTILSSRNSKLQAGGTFRCQLMVNGEVLSIVDLVYPGQAPIYYCCGKVNGVRYSIISPEED